MPYTAVVLTEESRKRVLSTFADLFSAAELIGYQLKSAAGAPLVHHVTLHMGVFDSTLNKPELLGRQISFQLVSLGRDNKVIALGVECTSFKHGATFGTPDVVSNNIRPHVTAMINPANGGKPFSSNSLTQWNPITPMTVKGVLQVCE